MRIKQENADALFTYLSINGKALTPDNNVITVSKAITGALTTPGQTFTDRIASRNSRELALNFTITAASGTLGIDFLVLDVMEPSNGTTGVPPTPLPPPILDVFLTGTLVSSAPTTIRFVIVNGQANVWTNDTVTPLGPMNVPMLWQVKFTLGGTSPSFSMIGTFEERQ